MLFLITKKQKEKILDEYHSNLINIFAIGLALLTIVFLASVFPVYLIMKVDRQILTDKVSPLQTEIDLYKTKAKENNAIGINNDISILSMQSDSASISIYNEIKSIYRSIPNVQLVSITVDTLAKKVIVTANIDNKNTASILVDKLNTTRYKGADLPYSVFSQSKNFIFNQTLSYE